VASIFELFSLLFISSPPANGPLDPTLDHATLENMLFPEKVPPPSAQRAMPPKDYIFREMKRKGVTLQLLWYEYSQFCHRYRHS
jgi:hypothetical protein